MAPNNSIDLTGKIAIVTGSGKENGIGAGIATALARAGARVAINYVSEATEPRANQVVAEIQRIAGKGTVTALQADIRTPAGAKKLIDGTLAGFGVDHVDILGKLAVLLLDWLFCGRTRGFSQISDIFFLFFICVNGSSRQLYAKRPVSVKVNNAAWSKLGPALDSTPEDTLKCFEVNVFGPLYLMQFAVPHMPRGGRIINVGSVASKLGIAGMPLYVASKGAMDALTFVLAREVSAILLKPRGDLFP